jgi:hypothetical protein
MRITRCVPLAGEGVIARYGALVAVTDGRGPCPDPLLSALAEVAEAAGDGSDLVLRAARAALSSGQHAAFACAGVMADGGVAVLVHGRAVATVGVEGGPDVTLTPSDSMLPVSRTFAGATVTVGLAVGEAAPPDPRFWLGDGVVQGGGLAVTVSAVQGIDVLGAVDDHPPTIDTPAAGTPDLQAGEASPQPVLVEGVLCARDHFNDPGAWSCRECGIALDQPPRSFERRRRPSLGVLVLDDGTRFALDGDYVLGREPALDGDVLAGRARSLRINDPNGSVSRLHLKISLVGWQVEVSDLGSANGTVLQSPDGERTLTPFEPTMIEPGARIGIGHRSMQYLAYQGVHP